MNAEYFNNRQCDGIKIDNLFFEITVAQPPALRTQAEFATAPSGRGDWGGARLGEDTIIDCPLTTIQIFKIYEILFTRMDAVANLDELKLELKRELRQEILTEILNIIRDEFYPPEEKIRKDL